ncbi:MAG: ABC transporter permease [Williamsia sp.]|nr:ABC transporter permease [Williamsia sp.]
MKPVFILSFLVASLFAGAQQSKPITEEDPLEVDGIEYGFAIRNASTREVGNKDFSRYEVTFYATNKSQCSRVILFGQSMSPFESDVKLLAKFDCINATGARLTSKSGEVSAKPMFVNAKVNTKDDKGKSFVEMQKVQIGFYVGIGETIEQNVILIVPLNSKPDVRVRVLNSVSTL